MISIHILPNKCQRSDYCKNQITIFLPFSDLLLYSVKFSSSTYRNLYKKPLFPAWINFFSSHFIGSIGLYYWIPLHFVFAVKICSSLELLRSDSNFWQFLRRAVKTVSLSLSYRRHNWGNGFVPGSNCPIQLIIFLLNYHHVVWISRNCSIFLVSVSNGTTVKDSLAIIYSC